MEAIKNREFEYPVYILTSQNTTTTPEPKVAHYYKGVPTGQFKNGEKEYPWQKKLEPGAVANIQLAAANYDLTCSEQKAYWEGIGKKLQQNQLKFTINDWKAGNTDYNAENYGAQKRIPGYFTATIVEPIEIKLD